MKRQAHLHKLTRLTIIVSLFISLFIFFQFLQGTQDPLLIFTLIAFLFIFFLFLLNPLFNKLRYRHTGKSMGLTLIFLLALSFLSQLYSFYLLGIDYYSINSLGIFIIGFIRIGLIFALANMVFSFKDAFFSAFFLSLFPVFSLNESISQAMVLLAILLILYSFKINQKSFLILTTLVASSAFMSACIIEYAYIIYAPIIGFFYFINALRNRRKPFSSLRFLFFFAGSGFLTTVFYLTDEYYGTSFWSQITLKAFFEGNFKEVFITLQERTNQIWQLDILPYDSLINYILLVLFAFLLFSFLAGLLNFLKDLHSEFILFALFPALFTLTSIFFYLPSSTLINLPFLVLCSSYGLTAAFSHISIPAKKSVSYIDSSPDMRVQLNPTYYTPKHWGKIVETRKKEEKPKRKIFRPRDDSLKNYMYKEVPDLVTQIKLSKFDSIIDSLFDDYGKK